ncbi:hypothetical protein RDABS01_010808 [Bienertia sinuspersici]
MDRRWMNHNGVKDRRKLEYIAGVNEFLQFAFRDKSHPDIQFYKWFENRVR